jgi:hypothetical protein
MLKEVLVRRLRLADITGHRPTLSRAAAARARRSGPRARRQGDRGSSGIPRRLAALREREIRQTADVGRIHRAERHAARAVKADPRLGELIRGRRSQQLDRSRRVVGIRARRARGASAVAEPDRRVLGKARSRSSAIACAGRCRRDRQGQCGGVRDVASLLGSRMCRHLALPRPVAEPRLPDGHRGFVRGGPLEIAGRRRELDRLARRLPCARRGRPARASSRPEGWTTSLRRPPCPGE